MATRISELQNGMINVEIEGVVRRKSDLCEGKNGAKFFNFYMYDNNNDFIRIVAFKNAAL